MSKKPTIKYFFSCIDIVEAHGPYDSFEDAVLELDAFCLEPQDCRIWAAEELLMSGQYVKEGV